MKKYCLEFEKIYKLTTILKYSIITASIVLIIDYFNLLSKIKYTNFHKVVIMLVLIYVLIVVIDLELLSSLKIEVVSDVDALLLYLIITSEFVIFSNLILNPKWSYKFLMLIILLSVILISIIYRISFISNKYKSLGRSTNVFELKELYEGRIRCTNELILINEAEVDYDLLSRENIIDNLYYTLINCSPEKKFVISLEGEWGSGKTTILNIVTKKINDDNNKDIIIIKDFDPWSYNDQCSMFRGMFDIILRESGLKYSVTKTNRLIDDLYNILFDSKYGKKVKFLSVFKIDEDIQISRIKSFINNYLEVNNKKIIFIIDNIDRASSENISLIFKLVSNIFDFKYITYILAFDDEKVKRVLENDLKIDYQYLKKIIQLQIKLPELQLSVKKDVVKKCLSNLLILYGEKKEELHRYEELISLLSSIIVDIRDLKRFLNSIMSFAYKSHKYLNPIDIIVIEFIKLYNNKLYKSIAKNKEFFISNDKEYCIESIELALDTKKFNVESKVYFDSLFSDEENRKYSEMLSMIFPYVKKYIKGEKLEYEGNIIYNRFEERKIVTRGNSICSAKFFDLYFTNLNNEFIYINSVLETFVVDINKDHSDVDKYVFQLINGFNANLHKVLFETVQYYIDDINRNKLKSFACALFKYLTHIDDSVHYFSSNAKSRVNYIIAEVLLKISHGEFNAFLDDIKQDYSNFQNINLISIAMKDNQKIDVDIKKERIAKLQKQLKEEVRRVYDNRISIYDEYYQRRNIWGMCSVLEEDSRDIKTYVSTILNPKNVVRFLYDIIGVSYGSQFNYYIKKENLIEFCTEEFIEDLVSKRTSNTKDELFILSVFDRYINSLNEGFGERGVNCDTERKVEL